MASAEVMTCEEDGFYVKRTPNKRFYFDDSDDEEIVAPRKIRRTLDLDSEKNSTTSDSFSTVNTNHDSTAFTENLSDITNGENSDLDENTFVVKRTPKKVFTNDSDDEIENTHDNENLKTISGKITENEVCNTNNIDKQADYKLKEKSIETYSKVEPQFARDKLIVTRDHFKSIMSYREQEEVDNVLEGVNDDESNDDEENSEDGYSDEDDDDDERDFPNHYLDKIRLFTEEQQTAFEYVIKLIKDPQFRRQNPRVVLIEGPAGTGKTELLTALCDYVTESYKGHAIFTAATGVAALKHKSGRTAHSAFGFPLNVTYEEVQRCCINEFKSRDLSGADLIVLDEFQSVNIDFIDMLDLALRDIMYSDKKFGGKVIVFGADFRQVVPVVPDAYDPSAFSPRHFIDIEQTKTFIFSQPCRMGRDDSDYLNFIKKLGSNTLTTAEIPTRFIPLEPITFTSSLDTLMLHIYPDELLINEPDECARRSILAPTSKRAQLINDAIARVMPETITLGSVDLVGNREEFEEYFNSDLPEDKVFPVKELEVWKGCLCMIMRSMYIRSSRLWIPNGTKVIVERIQEDSEVIWVRKVGDDDNNLISIERYKFVGFYEGQELVRVQFPLMLCYATTIHKSQGQTFDRVGVDVQEHVFRHGQLYLALSRVRSLNHMVICVNEYQVINNVAHAVNVVNRTLVTN